MSKARTNLRKVLRPAKPLLILSLTSSLSVKDAAWVSKVANFILKVSEQDLSARGSASLVEINVDQAFDSQSQDERNIFSRTADITP